MYTFHNHSQLFSTTMLNIVATHTASHKSSVTVHVYTLHFLASKVQFSIVSVYINFVNLVSAFVLIRLLRKMLAQ